MEGKEDGTMRILIAYASKYGTTKTCVERLANALKGKDVTVVSLEEEDVDPSAFDIVVFGSSVYFGKLRPAAAGRRSLAANNIQRNAAALSGGNIFR